MNIEEIRKNKQKRLSDKFSFTKDELRILGLKTLLAYANRKPDHKAKYIEL